MAYSQTAVLKLYHSVIEDVISGVRDSFLDEGVDEQILQELKQTWELKLVSSKAVEPVVTPPEPQPPQIGQKQTNAANKSGGANSKKASTSTALAQTEPGHMMNQSGTFPQHQPANQLVQQQQQQQQSGHTLQTTSAQQQQQQQQHQSVSAALLAADPNKQVPIQITLPGQAGSGDSQARILTIQVPASALQGNQLHTVLTGPVISATMALPQHLACTLLQQHVNAVLQGQAASAGVMQQQQQAAAATTAAATDASRHQLGAIRQLDGTDDELLSRLIGQVDGPDDSSDDDDDDDDDDEDLDDDDNDEKEEDENEEENDGGPEEEPLNSGDDVSDEDPTDLFDTDNVVVCQYDKITRSRNKWKFYLKDGIMNLNGKDYVFQKANGDAEW